MNKGYRNVVFVGFNKNEQRDIKVVDTRKLKDDWHMMAPHLYRFPYVLYLENIAEGLKHQGFAIFIKITTKEQESFLYKHLRKLKSNYYHVILCTDSGVQNEKLETIGEKELYEEKFLRDLRSWYYKYIQQENKKREIRDKINMNPRKGEIAVNLKKYFQDKDSVTAKEIASYFKIPLRTSQRYIKYMNDIFENVKYDNKTKSWIKKI